MQAVLFTFCCVFILFMTRPTKYIFIFPMVSNSFFMIYNLTMEYLKS